MTSLLILWNGVPTDHHGCSCSVWNPHWQECCWKHEAKHKEAWACTWGSSLASPSSSRSTAKPSLKYSINIVENIIDHRFILLITNCQESLKGNSLVQATVLDWDGHLHKRRRRKMPKNWHKSSWQQSWQPMLPRYTQDIRKICWRYPQNIPKIYLKYGQDMPRHALDMAEICPTHAKISEKWIHEMPAQLEMIICSLSSASCPCASPWDQC